MSRPTTKFAPYVEALKKVSARTKTPLPSLILSFAVLHEITAVAPVVGFFFGARALGVGDKIIEEVARPPSESGTVYGNWAREKGREWVDEGGKWVVDSHGSVFHWYGQSQPSQAKQPSQPNRSLLPIYVLKTKNTQDRFGGISSLSHERYLSFN